MTPVLTTDRLHLVAPNEKHVAAYTQFIASDRAAALGWSMMPHEAWRSYAAVLGHQRLRGFGPFIAEARGNGRVLGIFGPWWPEGQAEPEIKWTIFSPGDEGRGFATEAAQACLSDAFSRLGWSTAVSYITEENARSAAVATRLGAVHDGNWTTPRGTSVRVFRHAAPTRSAG